ncbi:unnamed protein product, partial [Phaeothamnion confervicola]
MILSALSVYSSMLWTACSRFGRQQEGDTSQGRVGQAANGWARSSCPTSGSRCGTTPSSVTIKLSS